MRFSILTLFPEYFQSPLSASLLGRAQGTGVVRIECVNLRDFGEGKYRAVDDKPYGGGAGMVLMPQVLEGALASLGDEAALAKLGGPSQQEKPHVVYLSPQGKKLDSKIARRLAAIPHIALVCGHYEGIDERALETLVDEEISIGDYVLTGGEPAAVVLIDAISRFIPGVVGQGASVEGDTFEGEGDAKQMVPGGLKYPMYTRPAEWRGLRVPEVLTSGNHAAIAAWRRAQSEARTAARRPDLLSAKPSPVFEPLGAHKSARAKAKNRARLTTDVAKSKKARTTKSKTKKK